MGTVVINGVPLACSRNPPLQINGQKVWSPDININGQMITGVNINGYDYPPAPAGSVLYLPGLPGQGSTIWDRSDKGNNGAITGATWTWLPSGLPALSFDGNDWVNCGDAASLQEKSTLSFFAWVKRSVANQNSSIASKNDFNNKRCWFLRLCNAADGYKVRFYTSSDGIASANVDSNLAISDITTWHHVGFTYQFVADNTSIGKIYIDGALDVTSNLLKGDLYTENGTPVAIGTEFSTYPTMLSQAKASIALEKLVASVWTAAQVANDFNQERSLFGV